MTLANLSDRGHDNNFNLIRLVAALVVVVGHSFPLSGGPVEDPLAPLGITMGEVAVDVFFITSGFLVCKSLLVRNSLTNFIVARVLRIYPGLIVMVAVTIVVAGMFAGPGFYSNHATWEYILDTAFLNVVPLENYRLPGIFESNPWRNAVNGSLYTLPFEIRMYVLLAGIWLVLSLSRRLKWMVLAVAGLVVAGIVLRLLNPGGVLTRFIFMFFTGSAFYLLRNRIRIDARIAWAALATVCVSALWPPSFFVAYNLLLAYLVFALAYLPRLWKPTEDYSYGVYIYAFPVQQAIVAAMPGVSWWAMTLSAWAIVLPLAAGSWHLVEKPAMSMKHRFKPRIAMAAD